MDERDALLRVVVAAPDDDLPRLVLADYLEERGEEGYAAFIRTQVELARAAEWEPPAVDCRHHRRDALARGTPWRGYLPPVDGARLEWHPDDGFRRGFGWGLVVRDMAAFASHADRLFAAAPVAALYLPTATLDDWRWFAAQPWLPRVKRIHFYGLSTPIEPVRELSASPLATGVEDMMFGKASSPAMPEILAGLFRSPIGGRLRRIALHVASDDLDELIDTLAELPPGAPLERLELVTVSLTPDLARRLAELPVVRTLAELDVRNCWLATAGVRALARALGADRPANSPATVLRLSHAHAASDGVIALARSENLAGLRALDLSGNRLTGRALRVLCRADAPAGLRALSVATNPLGDEAVAAVIAARFWPTLVELDLRRTRMTDTGAARLLAAPVPAGLTALLLDGNPVSPEMCAALRGHFGDRVSVGATGAGNGLD
ncbi:TIGR02996 domain-containing protein [Fimbriiglobus ruber]|uniref:TIGR02996 domain-containing protein n=1 Tax=Fimbriiglobus ruber TaxID=1908690 RepID=A0A225DUC9_9BACT|nr:TIGR02996 domain-containing protein [Fimbriiglobus ruber]OWK45002.1 hypothetical protein FRUB_01333 [Fimbriiglobus ruber]